VIFRLKTVEGVPEDVELGIGLFRDVVSGCCTAVDGFRAGYFLVDRERGRTVTLTLWDDRESLAEGVENLVNRLQVDEDAAATVSRVNSHGVRFDTFELAHEIGPER
jgi:hypothetical protein